MDLPEGFIKSISKFPELDILSQSLLSDPEISVRFNPLKTTQSDYPESTGVPWCNEGMYLDNRPQFTFDPSLHQGRYYVQDASSMAITSVLRQLAKSPVRYLDACAAPGGKTTAALSVLPEGSVVVANEFDFKRADILVENIAKWGYPDVLVSRGDTKKFTRLQSMFDIVSVDAPCSGEGMMRKDLHAREQWSDTLVRQCASIQREILANVWNTLRPGGYLVYSTCTFNRTENEENVQWLMNEYDALPVKIDEFETLKEIQGGIECEFPCYRFIPGKVRGEGLFIAVLNKGNQTAIPHVKKQSFANPISIPKIKEWILGSAELLRIGDDIYALPKRNASFLKSIACKLDTIYIGVHVATVKGKDYIPTHELALSLLINTDSFVMHEVSYEDAIRFLQRETIILPENIDKGIVLLTYNYFPLGFVKNIGSRANNLLPKQWCIKSNFRADSSVKKVIDTNK